MKTKNIYKALTGASLMITLIVFTHCVQEQGPVSSTTAKVSSSGSDLPPDSPDVHFTPPAGGANTEGVALGVKDFEELDRTMSYLTGVKSEETITPDSNTTVYGQVKFSLPTDNDVTAFLASNQIAITKLASRYCDVLFDTEVGTYRALLFPGKNFDAPWSEFNYVWTKNQTLWTKKIVNGQPVPADNLGDVIETMLEAFWGEGLIPAAELESAHSQLTQLAVEVAQSEPNSAETSKAALKAACSVALSSPYVTLK